MLFVFLDKYKCNYTFRRYTPKHTPKWDSTKNIIGENMEEITWPVAVSIMGTLVIIAGFLLNFFKKADAPWSDDLQKTEDKLQTSVRENEHRTTVMEGKQHELVRRVDELKLDLKEIEDSSDKKMEKIEENLEKITQLMIDILQNAGSK